MDDLFSVRYKTVGNSLRKATFIPDNEKPESGACMGDGCGVVFKEVSIAVVTTTMYDSFFVMWPTEKDLFFLL